MRTSWGLKPWVSHCVEAFAWSPAKTLNHGDKIILVDASQMTMSQHIPGNRRGTHSAGMVNPCACECVMCYVGSRKS